MKKYPSYAASWMDLHNAVTHGLAEFYRKVAHRCAGRRATTFLKITFCLLL